MGILRMCDLSIRISGNVKRTWNILFGVLGFRLLSCFGIKDFLCRIINHLESCRRFVLKLF